MALRLERYGKRFWGVYEDHELLCVTVYKKGALALIRRIEEGGPGGRTALKKKTELHGSRHGSAARRRAPQQKAPSHQPAWNMQYPVA